jgi:Ca2+-binding EF-hand superfamily protein
MVRGDNLLEPRASLRLQHGVTSGSEKFTRHSDRQFAILGWHAANNAKQLERLRTASIYGNLPPRTRSGSELSQYEKRFEPTPFFSYEQTWKPSSSRSSSKSGTQGSSLKQVALDPVPQSPPVDLLIDGMRHRLEAGGTDALVKLLAFFKQADSDKSGTLDLSEFSKGLMGMGLLDSPRECALVFRYYDADETGFIDTEEFLDAFRGKLPEHRRQVVHEAFNLLDRDGNGVLDINDLKRIYKTYAHPDVKAGIRTESEVLGEFLSVFDTIHDDGSVGLAEFEQYYEGVSILIKSDAYFESMLRNTWHLPGAGGGHCLRLHIARDVRDRRTHELKIVQEHVEIRPDIGINRHDPRFFKECKQRLEEMGYDSVIDIEVLGRY